MWNIIIGVIFIIGGLSGELVLRGTDSSGALVVVGIGLSIYGIIQVSTKKEEIIENKNLQVIKNPENENLQGIVNPENEIDTNVIKVSDSTSITLPSAMDDVTKETIRGMFMEEAYRFVSEKYNVSVKEAKKIVKEIKFQTPE